MDSFRQDGQLKAFNASYRAHRLKHNGSAPTYHQALNELRAELIRAVVEAPRGELPVAMLSQRIRQRFPWYVV
jgi:hypothetical protein